MKWRVVDENGVVWTETRDEQAARDLLGSPYDRAAAALAAGARGEFAVAAWLRSVPRDAELRLEVAVVEWRPVDDGEPEPGMLARRKAARAPRCSNCGHRTDTVARCATCARQLVCGSMGEPCEREGCGDSVLAARYESDADAREGLELNPDSAEPPRRADSTPE